MNIVIVVILIIAAVVGVDYFGIANLGISEHLGLKKDDKDPAVPAAGQTPSTKSCSLTYRMGPLPGPGRSKFMDGCNSSAFHASADHAAASSASHAAAAASAASSALHAAALHAAAAAALHASASASAGKLHIGSAWDTCQRRQVRPER